jgi:hypothetical protein
VGHFKVPSRHLRGSTDHRFAPIPNISVRLPGTHLHAVIPLPGQATALTAAEDCFVYRRTTLVFPYLGTYLRAMWTVGFTAFATFRGDLGP